jgi:transcriptional regulator GlxA family with amidase domain
MAIYGAATTWIDDHASLPVTADDAARAVETSAAGRRRAFAANGHLAFTPEAYLARVSAAHADLVASDPTRSSVASIALRWGFVDVLAFVAAYRAAYRTDPHFTLER